jgi:hypothetical protein
MLTLDVGITLARLGKQGEALQHLHEALRTRKAKLPADDLLVTDTEYWLGFACWKLGKLDDAVPQWKAMEGRKPFCARERLRTINLRENVKERGNGFSPYNMHRLHVSGTC